MTTSAADRETVIRWIKSHVHPLTTLDPQAPLTDLEPLRDMVHHAKVVGLGRTTHGAHELSALTHRILRFLVEHLGFRSLAIEEDWTKGIEVDEYLQTGKGDPRALLHDAFPHWQTEEFLAVLRWMRTYNEQHSADPVRFVGVDIVRILPDDAVADYVRKAAPDRLNELQAHFAALHPDVRFAEHTEWYRSQPDKQPFIGHARLAHGLVASLPADDGHAVALHHARAIVDFYEFHAIDSMTSMSYLEARLAENTIWWHEHTGHKVVYWSGSHSAVGHARSVSFPPAPPKTSRNAGSYLREHFGSGYRSVGLTFHHGSVNLDSTPQTVPAPSLGFTDTVLGSTGQEAYLLGLHADQPDSVRAWLEQPAKLRLIGPRYDPADDAANGMSGGSLAEWFDIIIHSQEVTSIRLLA